MDGWNFISFVILCICRNWFAFFLLLHFSCIFYTSRSSTALADESAVDAITSYTTAIITKHKKDHTKYPYPQLTSITILPTNARFS